MKASETAVQTLRERALRIRMRIVDLVGIGRAGHLGGSCSLADIMAALYFYKMRLKKEDPKWPGRDRLILSKGHAALCQYAALCELGILDESLLDKVKMLGSPLQGHPDMTKCPGIEANTGSLGQGLSIALGMALGLRLDGGEQRVYCILGDGELNEGQVWEAAMAAAHYKTQNLTAIVDRNGVQATGPVAEIMDVGDVAAKFAAFGWNTIEIDGHDMVQILDGLEQAEAETARPSVIIAYTTKGKGVDFAEGKAAYHNGTLDAAQFQAAKDSILRNA